MLVKKENTNQKAFLENLLKSKIIRKSYSNSNFKIFKIRTKFQLTIYEIRRK